MSLCPPDGVQVLPEAAIKGQVMEGGVELADPGEVPGGEVGEHLCGRGREGGGRGEGGGGPSEWGTACNSYTMSPRKYTVKLRA